MKTSVRDPAVGPAAESGEEEGEKIQLSPCVAPGNCLPPQGISVLEKLIKTFPAWFHLSLSQETAAEILRKEPAGIFMVRKEEKMENLFLSVHNPSHTEASEVLEYTIKKEKSLLYLEGSLLVFEDIFRLVAFYCVSRDLLPFTLRLPQAILEARSVTDLEIISSLGIGFWDSSLNQKRRERHPHSAEGPAFTTAQVKKVKNSTQCFASGTSNCSCETELSVGNDRLWFVNPIFVEERSGQFPPNAPAPPPPPHNCRKTSSFIGDTVKIPPKTSPSRRPPPPPPPLLHTLKQSKKFSMTTSEDNHTQALEKNKKEMRTEISSNHESDGQTSVPPGDPSLSNSKKKIPPSIPPRRSLTERPSGKTCCDKSGQAPGPGGEQQTAKQSVGRASSVDNLQCFEDPEVFEPVIDETPSEEQEGRPGAEHKRKPVELQRKLPEKPMGPPVPPPRKKRLSRQPSSASSVHSKHVTIEETEVLHSQENMHPGGKTCSDAKKESNSGVKLVSATDCGGSHDSLHCPVTTPASEPDSYSTSSTEDELESVTSPSVKKTHSMILCRAKSRLSMVSLSHVFTAFLSADRKLQKKIVELAQDKDSYFGNLVQDYKVYSLEMMAKQNSSTEMLQEIRLMMTQLKSYLIQSMELKSFVDQTVHTDEQLEVIIEAALHKCVLKPLKTAIDTYLREIHSKDGSFKLLKENQQIIQSTTTTDLGVTTSVPESAVLEKILHKFTTMHKAYSPEKKIRILLKSCKLIYDSMTQGNPGKHYGADDFLPVLMYVLARSDLTEVLLNVEYMMELMDPALQLGEGSYYLITTYGAVELIKSYDKLTVTRQLSSEVQDSIHRWERRRTLNKARASRSSVQDFIAVSFLEVDSETRTLAYRIDSTAHQLSQQCAEKFEVSEPQNYGLFVQVDDQSMQLDDDALPHRIKSHLLNKEPKPTFHFIYKQMGSEETPVPVIKDPDIL
uniref:Ras and Rab interactor 3 n=1 Tax=Pogona vitticeps TaxID=103695 RepID=A0ABM5FBB3_9SAUR